MSVESSCPLPFELVDQIFASVFDYDVLLSLTLVNQSAQIMLVSADKILFRGFNGFVGFTGTSSALVVKPKLAFLSALCAETASPRVTSWRRYLEVLSLPSTYSSPQEFDEIVELTFKLCRNLTAINLNRVPPHCLFLQRPSIRYIRTPFVDYTKAKQLSSPIFQNMTTFHPTHLAPEDWSSRLGSGLRNLPQLSQLALSVQSLHSNSLRSHVEALVSFLPPTVELVILSGNNWQLDHNEDFAALREGRLDSRFIFSVPTIPHPMKWVLEAVLFSGNMELEFWRQEYGNTRSEDSFWQEARDILQQRNSLLIQKV
ncbi:hypothetical protein DL96DRAFT_1638091 [Flagelloscypha sp. PMI_526]|nr:hypothetical protein DL96DRAFT_1638091 [Flagelloscypha sp. PMI_526]